MNSATGSLVSHLTRVLRALRQFAPASTAGDTTWNGPFFVDKGSWWPTRFVLYQDELYASAHLGWSSPMLVWNQHEGSIDFRGHMSFGSRWANGPELWACVLVQVEKKLASAARNINAYNARVDRYLPRGYRVGRIRRRFTWPPRARAPLSRAAAQELEHTLRDAQGFPSLENLTATRYLEIAAIAYDAAFAELRGLPPREKYARRADGRHGGLLDLAADDAPAFDAWFRSRQWQGCHPWEIIFAHPHGVMLSPVQRAEGWRLYLAVDTLGLYRATVKMAEALLNHRLPVELVRANEVISALRGEDWVEVGPFYEQLPLDELERRRPGSHERVVWEPAPTLALALAKREGAAGSQTGG